MVCSMLTVNPSANNVPDSHMRYTIELVTLLVKTSLSKTGDSNTVALRREDLQAFMNRVFLEDAIAFCTIEMSQALQQVGLIDSEI